MLLKNNAEYKIRLCLFHLYQSAYRHIQSVGLQALYADPQDPKIKTASHMLCALAFVHLEDVMS